MIDFSPVLDEVVSILVAIIVALLGVGMNYVRKWIGLKEESQFFNTLELTVQSGISMAANKIKSTGKELVDDVNIKNELMAEVTQYVIKSIPKLSKKYKVADYLEDFIEAKLVERDDIPTSHEPIVEIKKKNA